MPWAVYRICLQGLRFSWGLWSPGATPTSPNCPKPHPVQKEKTCTFSSGGTQALMWSQLPIKLLCSTHTSQPRSALISSCRIPTVHFSWSDSCCGKFQQQETNKTPPAPLRQTNLSMLSSLGCVYEFIFETDRYEGGWKGIKNKQSNLSARRTLRGQRVTGKLGGGWLSPS